MRHAAHPVAEPHAPPPARMRAVMFTAPGEFTVTEVPTPEPGPGEVLLRVHACMICATDRKILDGKFRGTTFPVIPGHELSGEIVDAFGGAARWDSRASQGEPPSRRVGVEVHVGCGTCARCREGLYNLCLNYGNRDAGHAHIGFTVPGGLAEYVAVPAAALHALPARVSYEDGAWTDNLGVALWALERGRLAPGDRVVIVGPGAIGLCAAQLAAASGAAQVLVVGHAGERLERARAFADGVIDHIEVQVLAGIADLVVEFAGTAQAARDALRLARRGGRVVLGGATGQGVELSGVDLSTIVRGHLDVFGSVANPMGVSGRALTFLARGKVDVKSLTTHHFPLERFAEAWQTFTERRDGAIRVMLHPGQS
jgi:threonine dehydrogenase-like Zn-dependent dehydrogenase